jgi:hypothetical protein
MRISGHETRCGADASSRTLVSGRARSWRRTHSWGGPTSFQSNALNQRAVSASTGVNPPSVLAGLIMLGGLYLWWVDLMTMRLTNWRLRRQS